MEIYAADQRGLSKRPWLTSYHTFSFDQYYDESKMGYKSLRVINEDYISAAKGFPTHHHDNMEIITYVISGALEHKDSLGNVSILRAGEMQRMTAGTGIAHSEYNPSSTETVHLYQIWIHPEAQNLPPSYEQQEIAKKENDWTLAVSPKGKNAPLKIHQDVLISIGSFLAGNTIQYECSPKRSSWLQVIKGELIINERKLGPGNGIILASEKVSIRFTQDCEILLFDMN